MFLSNRLALLFSCALLCAAASAEPFPKGCEVSGFGFQDPFITFNDTDEQTLFFVQNQSNIKIQLERVVVKDAFMSPKLQTTFDPGQWAALASDQSNTHFQCLVRAEDTLQQINCSKVLRICQYPRVKFALSNMGSYWVSTNKPQAKVIQDATKKGIYLKW